MHDWKAPSINYHGPSNAQAFPTRLLDTLRLRRACLLALLVKVEHSRVPLNTNERSIISTERDVLPSPTFKTNLQCCFPPCPPSFSLCRNSASGVIPEPTGVPRYGEPRVHGGRLPHHPASCGRVRRADPVEGAQRRRGAGTPGDQRRGGATAAVFFKCPRSSGLRGAVWVRSCSITIGCPIPDATHMILSEPAEQHPRVAGKMSRECRGHLEDGLKNNCRWMFKLTVLGQYGPSKPP